jgi:protein involved in polysaccharide export with SLBB domain
MKHIPIFLFISLFQTITGHSLAQEPKLSPGQHFQLRIAGVPAADVAQLSGTYVLSDNGSIKLPLLKQEIHATGSTPSILQKKIEQAYMAESIYAHPSITVLVAPAGDVQQLVTVGGEVRQPGEVAFRPGVNLLAVISKSGGPTEYANLRKLKLIRGKTERIIDFRKITAENNLVLQPGDQIIIPSE